MKRAFQKIGANWLFLFAVAVLYLILGLWDAQIVFAAFAVFLTLLKRMLPVLGVVFALLFLSSLLLNPKAISRYLGRDADIRAWPVTVVAGILSVGSIYLWYPLLGDLKSKGMRDALIAVFLYNRAVKIPLLPMMIYYFGIRIVVILTILMILFSILNGLLVERLLPTKDGGKKSS
jgi:uncharacterized membrane protein YraQ (UPF0718 family)